MHMTCEWTRFAFVGVGGVVKLTLLCRSVPVSVLLRVSGAVGGRVCELLRRWDGSVLPLIACKWDAAGGYVTEE